MFEREIGYSRAVAVGEWVFLSGTTGFDYEKMLISDDLFEQTEQCFKNIEAALKTVNSSLEDVVRAVYIFPEATDFQKVWPILKRRLGHIRPACMMFEAGLSDPRMKVEIEVTAVRVTQERSRNLTG